LPRESDNGEEHVSPLRVGVVFGGRSVEHEVSVITAHQVMAALDRSEFTPVPVYITKAGRWYAGEVLGSLEEYRDPDALVARAEAVQLSTDPGRPGLLRIGRRGLLGRGGPEVEPLDVVLPLVHGSHGEDGTLQGLCELADIAYCGPDVLAAALCMDKAMAKAVLRAAGLPVLDDRVVTRAQWQADPAGVTADIRRRFGSPVFVKPLSLGSSIGVSRAETDDELALALDLAFAYQDRAIVEAAQDGIIEINCSVLGDATAARASVCEQPVSSGILSYEDKYMAGGGKDGAKGGAKADPSGVRGDSAGSKGDAGTKGGMSSLQRIIPAPIDATMTALIENAAVRACAVLGVSGVARVDFLVRPEQQRFLVNEVNTIPGSLSFYLWEAVGVSFSALCTEVVHLGLRRHASKRASAYSIDSWLLRR
jgi:D-alanine-D-alanine ligase